MSTEGLFQQPAPRVDSQARRSAFAWTARLPRTCVRGGHPRPLLPASCTCRLTGLLGCSYSRPRRPASLVACASQPSDALPDANQGSGLANRSSASAAVLPQAAAAHKVSATSSHAEPLDAAAAQPVTSPSSAQAAEAQPATAVHASENGTSLKGSSSSAGSTEPSAGPKPLGAALRQDSIEAVALELLGILGNAAWWTLNFPVSLPLALHRRRVRELRKAADAAPADATKCGPCGTRRAM